MSPQSEIMLLLDLIEVAFTSRPFTRAAFPVLFRHGCRLLEQQQFELARTFGASAPCIDRWRRGLVVPPAARRVLELLRDRLEVLLVKTEETK